MNKYYYSYNVDVRIDLGVSKWLGLTNHKEHQ